MRPTVFPEKEKRDLERHAYRVDIEQNLNTEISNAEYHEDARGIEDLRNPGPSSQKVYCEQQCTEGTYVTYMQNAASVKNNK